MKRVVIVHCWDGRPVYCWYQSAKKELEAQGFAVSVPEFPDTAEPKLDKWLPVLAEAADTPDEELFLVGHSIGAVTIMRYLESLPVGTVIGGVVFVAGFTDDLGFDELKNFFTTPVQLENIKEKAKGFVAIHSDDDPYVALSYGDIFKEKLGAELIVKHAMKHFSGPNDDEAEGSCTQLPDVVSSVVKLAR